MYYSIFYVRRYSWGSFARQYLQFFPHNSLRFSALTGALISGLWLYVASSLYSQISESERLIFRWERDGQKRTLPSIQFLHE
jgi:hypothetical protein